MKHYAYFDNVVHDMPRHELVVKAFMRLNDNVSLSSQQLYKLFERLPWDVRVQIRDIIKIDDNLNGYVAARFDLQNGVLDARGLYQLEQFINNYFSRDDSDDIIDMVNDRIGIQTCNQCGEWEYDEKFRDLAFDRGSLCRRCIDDSDIARWSDYYDDYVSVDHSRWALNESGIEVIIDEDDEDFSYSDDEDTYVHYNYESKPIVIGSYHSSKGKFSARVSPWTQMKNRWFGVELEVEMRGDGDRQGKAVELNEIINGGALGDKVFFENDGSLNNGFEIISHPMGLDLHRDLWAWLKDKDKTSGIRSHNTTSCGLHVHVSRRGLTKLQIAKIVTFVNNPGNEDLIRAVARRFNEGYCKIKNKKVGESATSGDRYEAVNVTSSKTIEFRIFKGSLKYESVISAVQFANAVVEFCAPGQTSITDLNADNFLKFCEQQIPEDTDVLRPYIAARLETA